MLVFVRACVCVWLGAGGVGAPWWLVRGVGQAAELGIQLYEENVELKDKLADADAEVERLRSALADTSEELSAQRRARLDAGRQLEDLQREALR
jgi:hypothetical protein